MIAALRKSAKRLAEIVLAAAPQDNQLEFDDRIPVFMFLERLIGHYSRPFDGSYVKAFEFPVQDTSPEFEQLMRQARENGYHITHPDDGTAIFASSVDEVEQLLCQGEDDDEQIPESDWN